MKIRNIIILVFLGISSGCMAQNVIIKTNLLYGVYMFTPNLDVEKGVEKRYTLDIAEGYNSWNLNGDEQNNKEIVHRSGHVEYRYWFCQKFDGHFCRAHILGAQYDISQHIMSLMLDSGAKKNRYEGWGAGVGVSYDYRWTWGEHWNLKSNISVGCARLQYRKCNCVKCGSKISSKFIGL